MSGANALKGEAYGHYIPWAREESPLPIPPGTQAVVPELDQYGSQTGEYVRLSHGQYMREMGNAAVCQLKTDEDPEKIPEALNSKKQKKRHLEISTTGKIVPPGAPHSTEEQPDITSEQGEYYG